MSSKSRSKGPTRSQPKKATGGRTTASSKAGSRPASKATSRTEPKSASKERTPGLNVAAVDRLVARATKAIPKGRVRSAFSGTVGLSPNAVTVLGTLPAIVLVALSVSAKAPLLLAVALAVMVLSILLLMRFVNKTCIVAELPTELVGFTNRRGELEPRFRAPLELTVAPSFDPRWLKVVVGGDRLWVSKRTFGTIVERLAGATDEVVEVDDGDGDGVDEDDG